VTRLKPRTLPRSRTLPAGGPVGHALRAGGSLIIERQRTSYLTLRQSRSMKTLSRQAPLPSMLIAMPLLASTPMKAARVGFCSMQRNPSREVCLRQTDKSRQAGWRARRRSILPSCSNRRFPWYMHRLPRPALQNMERGYLLFDLELLAFPATRNPPGLKVQRKKGCATSSRCHQRTDESNLGAT
jgi:hypothetical protein